MCLFNLSLSYNIVFFSQLPHGGCSPCPLADLRIDHRAALLLPSWINMLRGFVNISEIQYKQEKYIRDTKYAGETEFMHFVKSTQMCCLCQHDEYDETLSQYLPKSNPRHQRPSLKAENGRDIRDEFYYHILERIHSKVDHLL